MHTGVPPPKDFYRNKKWETKINKKIKSLEKRIKWLENEIMKGTIVYDYRGT